MIKIQIKSLFDKSVEQTMFGKLKYTFVTILECLNIVDKRKKPSYAGSFVEINQVVFIVMNNILIVCIVWYNTNLLVIACGIIHSRVTNFQFTIYNTR